tara:strand:+ start:351 stop:539 length:189 start_codon:yes stop_codon:yes gene_type:complete
MELWISLIAILSVGGYVGQEMNRHAKRRDQQFCVLLARLENRPVEDVIAEYLDSDNSQSNRQ